MDKALLKENRVHGNISFPLDAYHMKVSPGGIVLDCHWHDELEFLVVTAGKAIFQIEADYFPVQAGEGIFVNAGELHAGYPLDDNPCSYKAIVFNAAMLHSGLFDSIMTDYIDPIIKNRLLFKRHFIGHQSWERELLLRALRAVEHTLNRSAAYELSAKSELLAILALLFTNSTPASTTIEKTPEYFRLERMKNALKYIQDNYSRKLSTLDISSYLNMSEGHFCRLFKQYFKRTPVEYLNYYRITRAARLLKETDQKVLEVAMEVGFDNISYFIGIFKRYMGVTPSKYRNQRK